MKKEEILDILSNYKNELGIAYNRLDVRWHSQPENTTGRGLVKVRRVETRRAHF
jgi:hypothetical protein